MTGLSKANGKLFAKEQLAEHYRCRSSTNQCFRKRLKNLLNKKRVNLTNLVSLSVSCNQARCTTCSVQKIVLHGTKNRQEGLGRSRGMKCGVNDTAPALEACDPRSMQKKNLKETRSNNKAYKMKTYHALQ